MFGENVIKEKWSIEQKLRDHKKGLKFQMFSYACYYSLVSLPKEGSELKVQSSNSIQQSI